MSRRRRFAFVSSPCREFAPGQSALTAPESCRHGHAAECGWHHRNLPAGYALQLQPGYTPSGPPGRENVQRKFNARWLAHGRLFTSDAALSLGRLKRRNASRRRDGVERTAGRGRAVRTCANKVVACVRWRSRLPNTVRRKRVVHASTRSNSLGLAEHIVGFESPSHSALSSLMRQARHQALSHITTFTLVERSRMSF